MNEKLAVGNALGIARRLFGSWLGTGRHPTPAEFLAVIRDFETIEFEVADTEDADGLLFEFGPVNWLPEPTFVVGVTRQLESVGGNGGDESYRQIAMEFHFTLDEELEAAGAAERWCFRGADDLSTWLRDVETDAVWGRVSAKTVREFVISSDDV